MARSVFFHSVDNFKSAIFLVKKFFTAARIAGSIFEWKAGDSVTF